MNNDIIEISQKTSRIIVFTVSLVLPGKLRKIVQLKIFTTPSHRK